MRHYNDPHRAELAQELSALCHKQGLVFIVAADPSLALSVQAAGLHWPQWKLSCMPLKMFHPPRWLITASVHDAAAVRAIRGLRIDATLLSPAFATDSHPDAHPLGPVRFAALARTLSIPVYALGGMTPSTMKRLKPSGATGFAAISALTPKRHSHTHAEYNQTASSAHNAR